MSGQSDAVADGQNLEENPQPSTVLAQTPAKAQSSQQQNMKVPHDSVPVNFRVGSIHSLKASLSAETAVHTKEELFAALEAGGKHIILKSHLDLSMEQTASLSVIPHCVQSLRVRILADYNSENHDAAAV